MKFSVARLSKKEIVWLSKHYCKHQQTFLAHQSCYNKIIVENPSEKVAILDIETTGLEADYNYCICYCFKELNGKIVSRAITKNEILNYNFDKKLIEQFVKDNAKYDRIISYYGSKFDLPFLRSRALKHNIEFPFYGEQYHDDIYWTVRYKLRLHRNSLASACAHLKIPAKQTHITEEMKERAMAGDGKSINKIIKHCKEDVISTEKLYLRVQHFARHKNSSI